MPMLKELLCRTAASMMKIARLAKACSAAREELLLHEKEYTQHSRPPLPQDL